MIYGGGYGILMTAAMTVGSEYLSVPRLPLRDWTEIHKNLHHIPEVILTGSVTGNAFITSFGNPEATCVVRPDSITGFSQMMDESGLYWPGRNGHRPGYQV